MGEETASINNQRRFRGLEENFIKKGSQFSYNLKNVSGLGFTYVLDELKRDEVKIGTNLDALWVPSDLSNTVVSDLGGLMPSVIGDAAYSVLPFKVKGAEPAEAEHLEQALHLEKRLRAHGLDVNVVIGNATDYLDILAGTHPSNFLIEGDQDGDFLLATSTKSKNGKALYLKGSYKDAELVSIDLVETEDPTGAIYVPLIVPPENKKPPLAEELSPSLTKALDAMPLDKLQGRTDRVLLVHRLLTLFNEDHEGRHFYENVDIANLHVDFKPETEIGRLDISTEGFGKTSMERVEESQLVDLEKNAIYRLIYRVLTGEKFADSMKHQDVITKLEEVGFNQPFIEDFADNLTMYNAIGINPQAFARLFRSEPPGTYFSKVADSTS